MKTTAASFVGCAAFIGLVPSVFGQVKPIATFDGHGSRVTGVAGVAFHPDGSRVVSVSFEGARIWDRNTGQEINELVSSVLTVPRCFNELLLSQRRLLR